jgi:hypothetical protein
VKTKGTDKLTLKATGGFQQYNRPNGETEDSAVFNATASLAATDKLTIQFNARNGTQLSSLFAGNGTEYAIYSTSAMIKVSPALTLSVGANYRVDDYLDPVNIGGVLVDRTDKGTGVRARAEYVAPSQNLRLYAQVVNSSIDSDASDYDQTLVSLGARLQY